MNDIFEKEIEDLGKRWHDHKSRLVPSQGSLLYWSRLIQEWSESELELFSRKTSLGKGRVLQTKDGGKILIGDNTPAHWVYRSCLENLRPKLEDIRDMLASDEVPLAMAMSKAEAAKADRFGKRFKTLNDQGYKLAHILPVATAYSKKYKSSLEIPLSEAKLMHNRFLNPFNLFLVPKHLSGLAEVPSFLKGFMKAMKEAENE